MRSQCSTFPLRHSGLDCQTEAAAVLSVSRRTLNNWQRQGYGPQPTREGERPGARLLYDRAEIEAFAAGAVN